MSLDVYLTFPGTGEPARGENPTIDHVGRIYVRRDGATVEITREEWDELYPGREPVVVVDSGDEDWGIVYQANITHNLNRMARECDLYEPLWRPELLDATHAGDLIEPLRHGLARLQTEYDRLQEFNPANGWGDYDGLRCFTAGYLGACMKWPDAEIRVSR